MIVVTDVAGPVGSLVVERLLASGERVRVIGIDSNELRGQETNGAELCCCDTSDEVALTAAFQGADAVYLAFPHHLKYKEDFIALLDKTGHAYAAAVAAAGVPFVVSLSSAGVRPQSGNPLFAMFYALEERLNLISGLRVVHLRPGHFLENLGIEILSGLDLLVGAIAPEVSLSVVFPHDIAGYAAERLQKRDFSGRQYRELLGERDLTMPEIAAIIGKLSSRPNLRYVQLPQPALKQWMKRIGLPDGTASVVLDVWEQINKGQLAPAGRRTADDKMSTSLEAFIANGRLQPWRYVHRV